MRVSFWVPLESDIPSRESGLGTIERLNNRPIDFHFLISVFALEVEMILKLEITFLVPSLA